MNLDLLLRIKWIRLLNPFITQRMFPVKPILRHVLHSPRIGEYVKEAIAYYEWPPMRDNEREAHVD